MESDQDRHLSLREALDLLGDDGNSALLTACKEGSATLTGQRRNSENPMNFLDREIIPKTQYIGNVRFYPHDNSFGFSGDTDDFAEFEANQGRNWHFVKASPVEIQRLKMTPQHPQVAPKSRGRKKGTGSFLHDDEPLLNKMHDRIEASPGKSVWKAAGEFSKLAKGGGIEESKRKRLAKSYLFHPG